MASAWGKSWGFSWGFSWGRVAPELGLLGGGHYADFWRRKWLKQWEKREEPPTLAEVLEFVEAEPEQAVAVVRQERPAVPLPPMPQIDFDVIARQIQAIVAARQAQLAEEDDEDVLLLMM